MARNIFQVSGVFVVGSFSSDPSGMPNGAMYYNTTTGKIKKLEAGTWTELASTEVVDNVFRITDDGDATKKIAFQAAGLSTATTRTITMPDSDVNLGLVATAIQSTEKAAANGVATLDAGGLIPTNQLPPLAITSVFVVANQAARLALTAQEGDVAIQTDNGLSYILSTNSPSVNADWKVLTAAGAVTSVNGQTGTVSLTTANISEVTNLYFTTARVLATAITGFVSGAGTVSASDTILQAINKLDGNTALKLSSVSQDTAPTLGGDLTLNAKALLGKMHRAAVGSSTNWVEEEYLHALSLVGSQTNTVETNLTFAFASFEGIEVAYKIKEATTNRVRIGTLRITTDGTNVGISDVFSQSADVDVSWDAAINGANLEVKYTTLNANTKTMRADVKRFKT